MKKQFSIIGILAILIGVGLSGCNSSEETSKLTSVSAIRSNVNSYIGKTVTIQGTCNGGNDNIPYMIFDSHYNSI